MTQSSEASIHNIPGIPEIDRLRVPPTRACRYRGRMLTARDFDTLLSIKDSVAGGHPQTDAQVWALLPDPQGKSLSSDGTGNADRYNCDECGQP